MVASVHLAWSREDWEGKGGGKSCISDNNACRQGGEEVVEGEDPSVVVYLRRDGH